MTGAIRLLLFCIFSLLITFAIYCHLSFPSSIKNGQAELFQSHPVADLSIRIFPKQTLKKAKLLKDALITKCQDTQINKNSIMYCGTANGSIISINLKNNQTEQLARLQNQILGLKLSRDQKILYFIQQHHGLCMIELQTLKITELVSYFEDEYLQSLNSIQTHPQDPNLIYFDQSMTSLPMHKHKIQVLLNQPNGRLFKYSINQNKTELICDGLYFANGLVFQKHKKQDTLLVAETTRYRIMRVYLDGDKKGRKEIAVDKLHVFVDNMKQNQKGEIWVASPNFRDNFLHFLDYHPAIRTVAARIPECILELFRNKKKFGGVKITFNQNESNEQYQTEYYLWQSPSDFQFNFVTSINQHNNSLIISSLKSNGLLIFDDWQSYSKQLIKTQSSQNNNSSQLQSAHQQQQLL